MKIQFTIFDASVDGGALFVDAVVISYGGVVPPILVRMKEILEGDQDQVNFCALLTEFPKSVTTLSPMSLIMLTHKIVRVSNINEKNNTYTLQIQLK